MTDEAPKRESFSPFAAPPEGLTAKAGTKLPPGTTQFASEEAVIEALRSIHDPEIPVNIHDLGLIYEVKIGTDGSVDIEMTLTAPGCPVADAMPLEVAETVASVENVGEVRVSLVWEPPWDKEMMSEEARLALGFW
jgi:FeS assembly SUF system protein